MTFGFFTRPTSCSRCSASLCGTCAGKYPLIPFDVSKGGETVEISKQNIETLCKACFERTSTLDFSKTYDVMGPEGSTTTIVLVHGGGGSRAMFRPHARILAEAGFRCLLPDLPGHGSLVDMNLTLESCTSVIRNLLVENSVKSGDRVIYVGASFGAYLGFEILDRLQEFFSGAVMLDCGQNVGPGASLKARAGLWMLRLASSLASNNFLMSSFVPMLEKSRADFHLIESTFGAGVFFDQGAAICNCMQAVAPADKIPNFQFPVLFFNGSEDYRDSEGRWLDACERRAQSSLTVFEGGDHFFTHDSRFVNDFMDTIVSFSELSFVPTE